MSFPQPSEVAAGFHSFFTAARHQEALECARLADFLAEFDQAYHRARRTRAADTPHLDILSVFGLQFRELRHSDALAWFLRPDAEHEQGPLFVNALLERLGGTPLAEERYSVDRERHGRTDVACYAPGRFAVFIENKVRHLERDQQVADMVQAMVQLGEVRAIRASGASPSFSPTMEANR